MINRTSSLDKSAGIISKPGKAELATIVPELLHWLGQHGYHIVVDRETEPHAPGVEAVAREEIAARPLRFVVVLGGDGTLLSAARSVARAGAAEWKHAPWYIVRSSAKIRRWPATMR